MSLQDITVFRPFSMSAERQQLEVKFHFTSASWTIIFPMNISQTDVASMLGIAADKLSAALQVDK